MVDKEEECKEEWSKRKKGKLSYINPVPCKIGKTFEKFKLLNNITESTSRKNKRTHTDDLECTLPKMKRPKSTLEPQTVIQDDVEILNDLDVLALGSIDFILPDF